MTDPNHNQSSPAIAMDPGLVARPSAELSHLHVALNLAKEQIEKAILAIVLRQWALAWPDELATLALDLGPENESQPIRVLECTAIDGYDTDDAEYWSTELDWEDSLRVWFPPDNPTALDRVAYLLKPDTQGLATVSRDQVLAVLDACLTPAERAALAATWLEEGLAKGARQDTVSTPRPRM